MFGYVCHAIYWRSEDSLRVLVLLYQLDPGIELKLLDLAAGTFWTMLLEFVNSVQTIFNRKVIPHCFLLKKKKSVTIA